MKVAQVSSPGVTSLPSRLDQLAENEPDRVAMSCGATTLTRAQLVAWSRRVAAHMVERGIGPGDYVAVILPNSVEWVVATLACWYAGAVPQPLSPRLAAAEMTGILRLIQPAAVIGAAVAATGLNSVIVPADLEAEGDVSALDPTVISPSWKAPASGGSTGRPKVVIAGQPAVWEHVAGYASLLSLREDDTTLVTAPLSHNGPMVVTLLSLLTGAQVVVTPRFDAAEVSRLITERRVTWVYSVPTMMARIAKLESRAHARPPWGTVRVWMHMAAPCPPHIKEQFIDWLGAERVLELYAGTEAQAVTIIDGRDWLSHRGSVGRPIVGEVQIRDDHGNSVPTRVVGRVWLRADPTKPPPYRYIGAEPSVDEYGWETLGDLGWLDEDGFLYLTDRDSDMFLVGGSNVYPAEVEAALLEHPAILDACVIGVPDDDLGAVPHAIVRTAEPVNEPELRGFADSRLSPYKRPRVYEVVEHDLRDDAGKIRRHALREQRLLATSKGEGRACT